MCMIHIWLVIQKIIDGKVRIFELELEHSLFDKYKYTCMAKNTWLEKLYKYSRETKAKAQEYRYH